MIHFTTSHNKKRRLVLSTVLAALFFSINCLGTGEFPEIADADDGLPAQFVNQIGPATLDVLLASPYGETDPGLPVNHMLYLLNQIGVDRLVQVVQNVGDNGRPIVRLTNAIKRLGCNRATKNTDNELNIPADNHHMECLLSDYDYLNIMIELIDGIYDEEAEAAGENPVAKITGMLNRESIFDDPNADPTLIDTTDPDYIQDYRNYLEKLAFLIVYLDSTEKLIEMVNGTIDPRDVVGFIEQFDVPRCSNAAYFNQQECNTNGATWFTGSDAPVSQADIDSGAQLSGVYKVILMLQLIDDSSKLYSMINGERTTAGNAAEDTVQQDYIRNKLVPVLEGNLQVQTGAPNSNVVQTWTLKLGTMVNLINQVERMVEMVSLFDTDDIAKLITLVNDLNAPNDSAPANNAIRTIATLVSEVDQPNKMVTVLEESDPQKMADLINDLSTRSQQADNGSKNLRAAGLKLAAIIDQVSNNNGAHCTDPAYSTQAACEAGPDPDGAGPALAPAWMNSNLTRLSYIIENIDVAEKMSRLMDELSIANASKLGDIGNNAQNWSNVTALLIALNSPLDAGPANNSIRTMAYTVDNVNNPDKIIYFVDNINQYSDDASGTNWPATLPGGGDGLTQLYNLVNDVATGSQTADDSSTDRYAAGRKLTRAINVMDTPTDTDSDGILDSGDTLDRMIFAISYTTPANLVQVVNTLSIASSNKVGQLVQDTTGSSTWDTTDGNRRNATGGGKLVNIIEYTDDLSAMVTLIEDIDDGGKLSTLVNQVTNSSNVVALTNLVIADPVAHAGFEKSADIDVNTMVTLVNALQGPNDGTNEIPKLATLLNTLSLEPGNIADETIGIDGTGSRTAPRGDMVMVVRLMGAPSGNDQVMDPDPTNEGAGLNNMITLIGGLGSCSTGMQYTETACLSAGGSWNAGDTTAAQRMGELLNGITSAGGVLCYREDCAGPTYAKDMGLIRLMEFGVVNDVQRCYDSSLTMLFPGVNGLPEASAYVPQGPAPLEDLSLAYPTAGSPTDCVNDGHYWGFPMLGLRGSQMAIMVNQTTNSSSLIQMVTETELGDVVNIVGCADDPPHLATACAAIGE